MSTQDLHLQFLSILEQVYPGDIIIITNRSNKIKEKCTISKERHSTEYDVHIQKTRKNTKHIIIHRIRTTKHLRDIKTHPAVCSFLDSHGIFLKSHAWPEKDWDIVNLGWKLFTHPTRDFTHELHHQINQFLTKQTTEAGKSEVPPLRLVQSTPRITYNDTSYHTRALDFQTLRKHVSIVDQSLLEYFKDTSQYVKYSLKYKDPLAYSQSIQLQNKYISEFRTATIQGVSDEAMHYLQGLIKSYPGVHNIRPTNIYQNNGKWQVTTNKENFLSVLAHLHQEHSKWDTHLPSITKHRLKQAHSDGIQIQQMPTIKKARVSDDPSTESVFTLQDSYVTHHSRYMRSMTSVFTTNSESPQFHTTPKEIQFPNRNEPTWSEVASINNKTSSQHNTSYTTPSTIQPSTSTFQHLKEENEKLKHAVQELENAHQEVENLNQKVAELTVQLQQLQQQQKTTTDAPPQYITTAQAAELFASLFQQHSSEKFSPMQPSPSRTPTPPHPTTMKTPLTQLPHNRTPSTQPPQKQTPPSNSPQSTPPSKTRSTTKHTLESNPNHTMTTPPPRRADTKRRNTQSTPESFSTANSAIQDDIHPSLCLETGNILDSAERDDRYCPTPPDPMDHQSETLSVASEVARYEQSSNIPSTPPKPRDHTQHRPLTTAMQDDSGVTRRLFFGKARSDHE